MAENQQQEEDSKLNSPPFLEVASKSLGKVSRFAAGTKAGFAVPLINAKLESGSSLVSYIEAVKDGEEPINFGPDAVLVNYGHGWKLQAVSESDIGVRKAERTRLIPAQLPNVNSDGAHPPMSASESGLGSLYIAKVLLAFVMIFVLGAIFTLALENLPQMLLLINSYM